MSRPRKIDNERILAVTRRLLLERGVQVSTRGIAAEAGISEGVLFQRFGSKEGLIRAALELPTLDAGKTIRDAASGQDARQVLENIAVAIFAALRRVLPSYVPLIAQPEFGPERAWNDRRSPFQVFAAALEQHLMEARHEGQIWTDSPHMTAQWIVSAVHNAALLEVLAGPSSDINEGTVRDLIGIVWSGLKPGGDRNSA